MRLIPNYFVDVLLHFQLLAIILGQMPYNPSRTLLFKNIISQGVLADEKMLPKEKISSSCLNSSIKPNKNQLICINCM